ncbi:MAG: serine hydrolase [Flavobacteriales bacterium]|nr:serine hydrolase [Flavobacteriales bacterium]MBP6696515.1 serine hydrolase [Flavobacteriales bacterium]
MRIENSPYQRGRYTATILAFGAVSAFAQPNLDSLDAYISRSVQAFDQPGLAVGIVKDGQLIWSKGYGKLDLAKADPVTPNSVFYCASISKAFTACAIGLLVDEGKLSFDDPVRKHLPWFNTPNPFVTEHFMVRDLLCHRSGWITFDGDLLWYGTDLSQREILERHAKEPFSYEFRNEFGYSNLMFIAAAQVIEAVSGMTWDQFITTRIFQPLGMDRSRVETADLAAMHDVAMPHVRKGQDPKSPQKSMAYQSLQGADGACGVMSTVTDLAKWDAMWMNEGQIAGKAFLSKESWTTITTPQLSNEVGPEGNTAGRHFNGTAMGWFTNDQYGSKIITHSGGMPGFILNHAVVPEKDLAVIALGNGETSSVFAVTSKVLNSYLSDGKADPTARMIKGSEGGKAEDAKRVSDRIAARAKGTKPTADAAALTGTFADEVYGEATIAVVNGQPSLSFAPAKELFTGTLEHWHYDTWKWDHADPFLEPGYITFRFDADHKVTGFKVDLHSPDFHFYKLDFKKK